MSRWLVFDDTTAAAVREHGGQIELRPGGDAGDAVSQTLEQNARVVAVFPTRTPGKAVVLRVERSVAEPKPPAPPQALSPEPGPPGRDAFARTGVEEQQAVAPVRHKSEPSVSYAAGGFLGLSDEVVIEPEEPPKAKKWWQKLLD